MLANPKNEPGATHEYIDLTNGDSSAVQLAGWRIVDRASSTYTFPAFVIEPGETVRLHIAVGTDTGSELYWGITGPMLNNEGDVLSLYDSTGEVVQTVDC